MVEIVVAQRMWQRRDTAAVWASVNPVLAAGEFGVEIDAGGDPEKTKFKIGNGTTPWNGLPYASNGASDAPVEFRANATHIQWREVGTVTWINLVALSDLRGPQGLRGEIGPVGPPALELRSTATHIQWRELGGVDWTNLVSLDSIRGPQGIRGPDGLSAYQVAVANGFAGTAPQWLASLKGEKGGQGGQGPPGIPSMRRINVIANSDTGSVVCDWDAYDEIRVTLTADTTFVFEGALDGQGCVLKVRQNAVGDHAVLFGEQVRFNSLISTYNVTRPAGRADKLGFVYDGSDGVYDFVSIVPGI